MHNVGSPPATEYVRIRLMNDRYSRQILVPNIGAAGQKRIEQAKVLIIGMGGLGCTVAAHLAGAGVGQLTLVDHDIVDVSNLHRQILFREEDIGQSKAGIAAREVKRINASCSVDAYNLRLSVGNVADLVAEHQVVVDAADNFATSYLLSDTCMTKQTGLVSASVNRTFGYVGQFCGKGPSLRAVFPKIPATQTSCDTVGVTGPSVGVIASIQAQEVIKILVQDKSQLAGEILYLDLWNYRQQRIDFNGTPEPSTPQINLMDASQLDNSCVVLDVRLAEEVALSPHPFKSLIAIPLADLSERHKELDQSHTIVCACKSGQRALTAAQQLIELGYQNVAALIPA